MDKKLFELHAEVEQKHWWFTGRRSIMAHLVHEVLPPSLNATVIDVGCGTGGNIAALAKDYSCIGIDTSHDAIDLATHTRPDVRFIHGIAPDDLGAAAASADVFLLMDVIEHVPDDFLLVSTLLQAARVGAVFLITVPADMTLWSPHDVAFEHYRRYDDVRLSQVWEGLAVDTLLLSHFNTRLLPIVRSVRALNRMRGNTLGDDGTDLSVPPAPMNALLRRVFAGEVHRLQRALRRDGDGYASGVSMVAMIRKTGEIAARVRPASVPADVHGPVKR